MQDRFTFKNTGRFLRIVPVLLVLLCSLAGSVSAQCTWTASTVYPVPTLDMPVASVGTNLYAFAGVSNGALVAGSNKFDGTAWTAIAPLPVAVEFPSAVSDGTNIYIMGGANNAGTAVSTNTRYNVATNTYTTLAPFAGGGTWNHGAAFLNGKIYKIGGSTDAGATTNVQIYDIAANTWSAGAAYPVANSFVSVVGMGSYIYCAGGIGAAGTTKTYRYDPATNTWDDAAIADMPASRWGSASFVYRNGFVMAGGYVGGDLAANLSTSVISWDIASNSWLPLASLIGEKSRFAGTTLNDDAYVVGGRSTASAAFNGTNTVQKLTCPPLVACVGTPAPGNTFASATVVCPSTPITLSLQNATAGTGVTYDWQSSTDGGTTWVSFVTGNGNATASATPAVTTSYRASVTCSGATTNSTPIVVTITACTCINPDAAAICEGTIQRLAVAGAGVPGSVSGSSGTISVNVPDANTAGITSTIPLTIPAGATITSVVTTFNVTHTWDSDLSINIAAPNGNNLSLVSGKGGSGDNFTNTVVNSAITTPTFATGAAPFTGTWAPDALQGVGPTAFSSNVTAAVFNSAAIPAGTNDWKLALRDVAGGDLGILTSWSITVNYIVKPTAVWTGGPGTIFTNAGATTPYVAGASANEVWVTPTTTTTYTATISSGPCAGPNNVTVTVLPKPVVTVSPALGCGPLTITAAGAATYAWSPSTGLSATTGATITANPSSTTTYTVIGTGNNGCKASGVTATVNAAPTAAVIAPVAGSTFQISESFSGATVPPTGWSSQNLSAPLGVQPWFKPVSPAPFPAFSGAETEFAAVNYQSGAGTATISNWMFSPVVNIKNGDFITFYTRTTDGTFPDGLQLRLSTAGTSVNAGATATSVGDFTSLLVDINPGLTSTGYPTTWTKFTGTVSGVTGTVTGRFAFRYFVTNGGTTGANSDYIGIDDVQYGTPATVNCANVVTNIKVDITGGVAPYTVVFSNGTTSTTIANYTSGSNIQVSPSATTTYTIVSVTGANGCVGTGNSGAAVITITPPASVTTPPANKDVCVGGTTTFTTVNAPLVGNTFQWQVSTDGTTYTNIANGGVYSGATTGTLTITGATLTMNGYKYRVIITGSCGAAVTSAAGTLSVNSVAVIGTQPASTSVCATPSTAGATTTFTVAATGGNIAYQWQVSTDGGTTYTNVANGSNYAGATTATLTVTNATTSFNNYLYRVIVTSGGCTAVTSSAATLTIKPATVVVIGASPTTAIFPGITTTLTAAVSPSTGVTYTWFRNNVIVAGATTNTIAGITVDQLGTYKVSVVDANGCGGVSNSITIRDSATTTLFIYPNPSNGQFHVRYHDASSSPTYLGPRTLTIYDSKGSRVFWKTYSATTPYTDMFVDLSNNSKGIYTVDLTDYSGARIKTGRVLIQ